MYDHIGLKVKDLDAAARFYKAALEPLGLVLCSQDDSSAGFGPPDAPALWLYLATKGSTTVRRPTIKAGSRSDDAPS